jgi:hypothetical protein
MIFTTFTPLEGRTELVIRFLDEPSNDRCYFTLTMDEAEHFSKEEIEKIVEGYPAYQREARRNGTPMQGEGRVFPYDEKLIKEAPLEFIPQHWAKLWGVDFGVGHPFAAVLGLHDRDNDVIHIHNAIKVHTKPGEPGGLPLNHAVQMKQVGIDVPVAWPHDGSQREHDGVTIAAQYRRQGLKMLGTHATHLDGGYGTEAGILLMDQRMQNGQFKVAAHLEDWFQEFRNYHRKDGLIVKVNDDLMSASRILTMQIRSAQLVNLGGRSARKSGMGNETMASGLDFLENLF